MRPGITYAYCSAGDRSIEREPDPSLFQPEKSVDGEIIERAAQALFEFVFAGSQRLDEKHLWTNCDEATKEGFRGEARAVLRAVSPFILPKSRILI
jgi:hypothetical protein